MDFVFTVDGCLRWPQRKMAIKWVKNLTWCDDKTQNRSTRPFTTPSDALPEAEYDEFNPKPLRVQEKP